MADYRDIAQIAKQRRNASLPSEYLLPAHKLENLPKNLINVPRESGILSREEIEIVESEADTILRRIAQGSWSALAVTEAFCKVAAIAQQLTNCLTEILFPEAFDRARELDRHFATTGGVVGPLHGLPVSLKDCFVTPPHASSIGMACYANQPTEEGEQSLIVSTLIRLGAVVYVKTNVPVAMMMMETDNNIFGKTINPLHSQLSPGGSSGGESALLALHGSPLGVGTDIGGSIRIPAAFCSLYGLRPSYGRFPQLGTRSGIPGQEFVLSVNGPMARSLESLAVYSAAMLSPAPAASPWTRDPKTIPLPWRHESQIQPKGRKLRLGFIGNNDGTVTVHPPIERALKMTRKALEDQGHEIIDWATTDHRDIIKLLIAAFLDFGGPPISEKLNRHNEPFFKSMDLYRAAGEMAASSGTGLGPDEMRKNCMAKNILAKRYLDRWQATAEASFGKQAIDGIVAPVSAWAAVRAGFTYSGFNNNYFGFSAWVNLLDLPACTFPVTTADAKLDPKREAFQGLGELDETIQADYDAAFYSGAPVSLQLVGERLQEEKTLETVGIIRDALVASDGKLR